MSQHQKHLLLTPGPGMIPPQVRKIQQRDFPHHRSQEFMEEVLKVHEKLKYLFQTKNDICTLSASGTGAMEASVASLLSPGDAALIINSGRFGNRWKEICEAFGVKTVELKVLLGKTFEAETVKKLLQKNPKIKAVFTQLTESSTGITHDIEALGKVVAATPAVLVVDSISGLGAEKFYADKWHVDIALGSSQKSTMLLPGLSCVSVSEKAWRMIGKCNNHAYYFSLKKYRKNLEIGKHPFTPAIGFFYELDATLSMIRKEGLEKVWQRFAKLAASTRAGVQKLGFELFAQQNPSNALTAVKVPKNFDIDKFLQTLQTKHGVTFAGGQDELKGKIFRIGHLGFVQQKDISKALRAMEKTLRKM